MSNLCPGLNTMCISMARIDYAAHGGLNPPHVQPRATELLYLLHGSLYICFVTTQNKLFASTIHLFVFPKGLVHFQLNTAHVPTVAISALTSGRQSSLHLLPLRFDDSVLETNFQLRRSAVDNLKSLISMT